MSRTTDELSQQPGDSEPSSLFARFREARDSAGASAGTAAPDVGADVVDADVDDPIDDQAVVDRRRAEFTEEFGAEIRSLLEPTRFGLFGQPISDADPVVEEAAAPLGVSQEGHEHADDAVVDTDDDDTDDDDTDDDDTDDDSEDDDTDDDSEDDAVEDLAAVAEDVADTDEEAVPSKPTIFLSRTLEPKPSTAPIALFLPRKADDVDHSAPALSGLARSTENDEPATVPNLFLSSAVAPAEVTFVAAEEFRPSRYRWLLILFGFLAVVAAVWLTWLATSSDTVDTPVTTIEQVTTTASTADSTAASTTEAPTTVSTTVPTTAVTTVSTTVATTAAPPVAPTTPRRPATTRPRTTAAPTTAAPTTTAPSIPDLSLPPPTAIPTTAAPTTAASTTAAPTTAASTTAAGS